MPVSKNIKSEMQASGAAPIFACRAWVNFNGTGTVAIRAAGNVSSITDNGVGDFTVNFTTAMPDANYSVALSCAMYSPSALGAMAAIYGNLTAGATVKATTGIRIRTGQPNSGIFEDNAEVNVAIFR